MAGEETHLRRGGKACLSGSKRDHTRLEGLGGRRSSRDNGIRQGKWHSLSKSKHLNPLSLDEGHLPISRTRMENHLVFLRPLACFAFDMDDL